jgi:hypothetical protein
MLRNRIPDVGSELPMPTLGINLREPQHKLKPGECSLLQNGYFDGAVRPIPGTNYLTLNSLDSNVRARGGHRFYKRDGTAYRLLASNTHIRLVDDAGSATTLTSTTTADKQTYFSTWSILDRCYAANGSDNPYYFDGNSFGQLTGTNIPTPRTRIVPVLDRLMVGTDVGIERTNSRDDGVWSSNSSWATKRPVRPGRFSALHPFSIRGVDSIYPGALALQANAFYIITGTDYGSDVTASTSSTAEDSAIQLLDGTIGTSSPMSVCTVPGVGIFWVTSDLNVYFLPDGQLKGQFIGDKLQSRNSTKGLNDANLGALDQIWMEYFDRKLILGFPTGTNTYSDTQYWLDLRYMTAGEQIEPVWYGPQTVNTWGCVWREDQGGELALKAGEGKASNGVYIYKAYQPTLASHTVGSSTTLPTMLYQDRNDGYSGGSTLKYAQNARMTATITGGTAKSAVVDLGDNLAYRLPVSAWNG